MCLKNCTIIGAVMVLMAAVSLAAEPVATFDLDGNNGVNVSYVDFCDYEGARQIYITWSGGENPCWLVSISDLSALVFGVWVDSTEVTNGAYASVPHPYNTYFLLGVAAYTGAVVDPAFEILLYWDQDGDGDKDTGDTLEDTAIMYTF